MKIQILPGFLVPAVLFSAVLRAAEPVQLSEVVIHGDHPPSLTSPPADAALEALRRVPGGVNLIDSTEVLQHRASTLSDIFENTPGVIAQPRFGAQETRLSIRGSGIQRTFHLRGIRLLQDGIPINSADGSGDFQSVEPMVLQYTEVFRGANAMQFGAATLGGAVNFVMQNGRTASPFQIRAEAGSFEFLRGQTSVSEVDGDLDYYLSASHYSQDGFRDHAHQDNQALFGNVGRQFEENAETRFYWMISDSQSALPGSLTKAQMEADPTQANAFSVAGDHHRDQRYARLANRTAWVGEEETLALTTYWSYSDLYHPIFQVIDNVSNDIGATLAYTHTTPWADRDNRFTAGVNMMYGWTTARRFVNIGGDPGAATADGEQRATLIEGFVENQHDIQPGLALVLGLQAVWTDRDFTDDFLGDGDQSDYQDFSGLNPKVGLIGRIDEESQWFANVSRSFEPPSYGELSNVGGSGLLERDAQTAWTVEVGTRGGRGGLEWDVAWYHAWVKDELLAFNVGPGGASRTVNADDTFHRGVEAGLQWAIWQKHDPMGRRAPADRVAMHLIYNWNDFRFDDDASFGDNRLPGIPEHVGRVELRYENEGGFYIGTYVQLASKAYADMANDLEADSYATLGLRVGGRGESGWSWFVDARNLTDEIYAASTGVITSVGTPGVSAAQFLPGDGR